MVPFPGVWKVTAEGAGGAFWGIPLTGLGQRCWLTHPSLSYRWPLACPQLQPLCALPLLHEQMGCPGRQLLVG